MGNIINLLLNKFLKKKKIDQTNTLSQKGIKFISAKNKHLRLYFQFQFNEELLPHIFEQRTFLLFGDIYSFFNLLNTDKFLNETFEKLVDLDFKNINNVNITKKYMDSHEMSRDFFNYKIITTIYKEYKICRVNYWVQKIDAPTGEVNISPKIIELVKSTDEVQLYNFLSNNNTGQIFFVLKKVFEDYGSSVTKIVLYQIGMKTLEEKLFTILAEYIRSNKKITSVCIGGISKNELNDLKRGKKVIKKDLEDEK